MICSKPNNCHSPRARTTAPTIPPVGPVFAQPVMHARSRRRFSPMPHATCPVPHALTLDKLPELDAGTGLSQYATRTSSFAGADAKSVAAAVAVVAVVVWTSCYRESDVWPRH